MQDRPWLQVRDSLLLDLKDTTKTKGERALNEE